MRRTYEKAALEMISKSSFAFQQGCFLYIKVKNFSRELAGEHFLVCKDSDETTIVTREENSRSLETIERNKDQYSLIALNVMVPFYSVGFLATVANAFAEADMNILIVSTYSKDYLLVREDLAAKARNILLTLGFTELSA